MNMDLIFHSHCLHKYSYTGICSHYLLGYKFLRFYTDLERSIVEFDSGDQSILARTRSHTKNQLGHKCHHFCTDSGDTHFSCMFFRLHGNSPCRRSVPECIPHLHYSIGNGHLHSYVLRMAICTCKYTPFHFAGIQGQQDWSTCSLFHNYCVGSMCRYMSLHEDKDATNKNSTIRICLHGYPFGTRICRTNLPRHMIHHSGRDSACTRDVGS